MSTTTSPSTVTTQPPGGPSKATRGWRWAAAFAVSWLLPAVTHPLGADWLLPIVLLAALVSVQRADRTLLDRTVLAVAQLFGALCAAGLVISVWPWHLHPVPIAGCAFTALVAIALVTGRRPRLPQRPSAGEVVAWLAALAVAVLAAVPFALRDLGGRIGLVAPGEDFSRHFMLYDMIGKVGGYAFLHRPAADVYAPDDYGFGYPQGTHLLYAVLDRFVRSSDRNADAVTSMDVLLWCHLGTYVFVALAILWAVRRVAGPGPGPAALLAVLGGVAAVLYFGDLLAAFLRGFPNELLGLALVAMLTAVVARPLAGVRDQVATVAALLVGVSFAYHLYLPYALVVAAAWAWHRRRALPWRFALVVAVVLAPLVLITPLENRPSGSGNQLLIPGTALPVDRPVLWLVVLAALAGVWLKGGWRSPARRVLTFELAVAIAMVAALFAYQYAMVGHSVYYFEKLLHMLLVVGLVAVGSNARLLPGSRPARAGRGPAAWVGRSPATRYAGSLAGVLVVAMALAAFGGRWHTDPLASAGLRYGLGLEKGSPAGGRQAVSLVRQYPDADGKVDVVLTATPYADFYATLFTAVMQRNYRVGEAWYVFLSPSAPHRPTPADLDAKVRDSPVPVRFVVRDPDARFFAAPGDGSAAPTNMEVARTIADRHPDKAQVLVLGS